MRARRGMAPRDVELPCKSLARFADNRDTAYDADAEPGYRSSENSTVREDVSPFFFSQTQTDENVI